MQDKELQESLTQLLATSDTFEPIYCRNCSLKMGVVFYMRWIDFEGFLCANCSLKIHEDAAKRLKNE